MRNVFSALSLVLLLSSCATTPLASSGSGFIVTDTKEGIYVNNNVPITKKGEACETTILGLVASGDTSIKTAKEKGDIKNVSTMDRTYYGILGIFGKSCLIVQGN